MKRQLAGLKSQIGKYAFSAHSMGAASSINNSNHRFPCYCLYSALPLPTGPGNGASAITSCTGADSTRHYALAALPQPTLSYAGQPPAPAATSRIIFLHNGWQPARTPMELRAKPKSQYNRTP